MDPDQIPLAALQQLENLLPVGLGFLGPIQQRYIRLVRTNDSAHRQAGEPHDAGDLASAHPLRSEFQNRRPLTFAQHALPPPLGFAWLVH